MEIDWSKAPEDATHFRRRLGKFYKQEGRAYIWLRSGSAHAWEPLCKNLLEFSWFYELTPRHV